MVFDALEGLERHQADSLEKKNVRVIESTIEEAGKVNRMVIRSKMVARNFQICLRWPTLHSRVL